MRPHQKSPRSFGDADYRQGALERLAESKRLLIDGMFSGSIYLAGRGVESMLRSVLWRRDHDLQTSRKTFDAGHDLSVLLVLIQRLGLLQQNARDNEFRDGVQLIGRLWYNNMRFASNRKVEADWRRLGELNKKRSLKKAASEYYDRCSAIVRRCEAML